MTVYICRGRRYEIAGLEASDGFFRRPAVGHVDGYPGGLQSPICLRPAVACDEAGRPAVDHTLRRLYPGSLGRILAGTVLYCRHRPFRCVDDE